jgi:hypothetical protein
MTDVPSSLGINIETDEISVSYINAQNVVLPLPDFDNQSQVNFPNETIISDSLFTSGNKAKYISSVSKNLIGNTFYWEALLSELSPPKTQKNKQQQLLSAIFYKIHRDAKVYLHHDNLSAVITVPQTIPASIFSNIVNLAKEAGFLSAQIIYKEFALMKEMSSTHHISEMNTVLINLGKQSTYIGAFDKQINQQEYEYIPDLNSSILVSEIYITLLNVYHQQCQNNISQEGKDKLLDISLMIIDSFSIGKETKVNIAHIVDGQYFSIQMNLHHFSSFIFPLLRKLIDQLSRFLNNNIQNNDTRYIIKCDWFQMDFVKNEFQQKVGANLLILPSESSSIAFGALKLIGNQQYASESSLCVLALPDKKSWGVIGIDSNNGQKIVDTIHSASTIDVIQTQSYHRQYELMTNEGGECYLPLGTQNNNNVETLGSITISSPHQISSNISIKVSFTVKNETEVTIDIYELQSEKVLKWIWLATKQKNANILEKMEMF